MVQIDGQMTLDNFINMTTIPTERNGTERNGTERLRVLELFSGMECISNAFRERGHECFTVDWDERFPSSLHKDISKLEISDIPWKPDVVFCGTDCTTYSVAAISHHRRKNPITGNLDPISDKARFADDMNRHVKDLIREMQPKVVIWENPVGALRKMDFMQEYIRNETTYCQWGV